MYIKRNYQLIIDWNFIILAIRVPTKDSVNRDAFVENKLNTRSKILNVHCTYRTQIMMSL